MMPYERVCGYVLPLALLGAAIVLGRATRDDRFGPERGREGLGADVTSSDEGVGATFAPGILHDVGEGAAVGTFGSDTGVKTKQRHRDLLE